MFQEEPLLQLFQEEPLLQLFQGGTTAPAVFNEDTFTGFDTLDFQDEIDKFNAGLSGYQTAQGLFDAYGIGSGNAFYDDYLNTDDYNSATSSSTIDTLFGIGSEAVGTAVDAGSAVVSTAVDTAAAVAKAVATAWGNLFND